MVATSILGQWRLKTGTKNNRSQIIRTPFMKMRKNNSFDVDLNIQCQQKHTFITNILTNLVMLFHLSIYMINHSLHNADPCISIDRFSESKVT